MLKYFLCFIKKNDSKPKFKRENTPHPKQSVIDLDKGIIEKVESKFENVEYDYIPNSAILHIYKKE